MSQPAASSVAALPSAITASSVGGAAALYGLLHQLTASVAMLVRAQFGGDGETVDPETITAVFEPASGGDVHLVGRHRQVLQFKHRSRPVSIGAIADEVLPDLFRAHCDAAADQYELHTTNGVSGPGRSLIAELKEYAFAQGEARARVLGNARLAAVLTALQAIFLKRNGAEEDFESSFGAFIARIGISPVFDAAQAREEAMAFLRRRIAYPEQAEDRLDQLVGYLAAKASANDAAITVDDLLNRLGLPGAATGHSDANSAGLAAVLQRALQARDYETDHDVRPPVRIEPDATLTLIRGPSGRGKSWALYRLATELARNGLDAVLIRADDQDGFERELKRAVRTEALQWTQPVEASLLGQTWRRVQGRPDAVITVLWEGCRDSAILDTIRLGGGFGPGLHIVAEYPVAHEANFGEFVNVPIHRVDEFTPSQLFDALERRGVSAGKVPQPIRRMLRVPVLCGIYVKLALELPDWDPETEYRVLADYWREARKRGGKFGGSRLVDFARKLCERQQTSLGDADLRSIGFSEAQLDTLIAEGWLSDVGGRWAFAHDRLLTWALAIMLAGDFEQGLLTADALAARVAGLQKGDGKDKTGLAGLDFLLMDVIWAIADLSGRSADVATFLAHFEPEESTGADTLYRELVHTAGTRVLPALEARAARISDQNDLIAGYLVAAFRALPLTRAEQVLLCDRLWKAETPVGRSIAISLGRHWPLIAHRDALWTDYIALDRKDETRDTLGLFERMRLAIHAIAHADPAWLGTVIETTAEPSALRLAAHVLKDLDHAVGAALWRAARTKLATALADDTIALECAHRFGDADDLNWLAAFVPHANWNAGYALDALATLDPDRALTAISAHPPREALPYGRDWLDRLLDHHFARTAMALRGWMIALDPTGGALARLWHRVEDRVDAATIGFLLDRLADAALTAPDSMRDLTGLLGSLTLDPDHDALFHTRRETPLAAYLAKRATDHFDGLQDPDYIAIRRIVRRIGGAAYEALILYALSPDALDRALTGIAMSICMPSPAVVARLEALEAQGERGDKDKALLLLWRTLLDIDPGRWRPQLLGLLQSDQEIDVLLALHLLPEYAVKGDDAAVHAAFAKAAVDGKVAERAMVVACQIGQPSVAMIDRAVALVRGKPLPSASLGCHNVLLKATSADARAVYDAYLGQLETARSWGSTDSEALVARLWRDEAPPALWRAADRLVSRRGFFGDDFAALILERDPVRGMDVLLERAFAPPDLYVRDQPEAIELIASVDKARATQAFVQSWNGFAKRRENLAVAARWLNDEAFEAMIASLVEEYRPGGPSIAYREVCIQLRHARVRTWPMLVARFGAAAAAERAALAPALGWAAASSAALGALADAESDLVVRRELDETRRLWARAEAAVARFRAEPTLDTLEHAIEVADPKPLCVWHDPLRIVETIEPDPRLVGFAESALARRMNALSKSKFERVIIRRGVDDD